MNNSKLIVMVEPKLKEVLLFEWAIKRLHVRNPVRVMKNTAELRGYLDGQGPYANRELFPLPAIVLLDLDLPGLEAANFLCWLRSDSTCKKLPVVGFSDFEVSKRVQAFMTLGMNGFFQKRLNLDDTLECLRNLELLENVFEKRTAPASLPGEARPSMMA
jgi:DNA-binding NarL/FixJ family response regulator